MPLFLREDDVKQLLTMDLALESVEEAFRLLSAGQAIDIPRERTRLPKVSQHILQGALPTLNVIGYKHYTSSREGIRFLIHLFDAEHGALTAVLEGNTLGMMRTGAASAVATRILAREDAATLGLFGSGWQATGQLRAIAAVRKIDYVKVFGRNPDKLATFCDLMTTELGVQVEPSASAEDTVRGSDIVTTITRAATPLFDGDWLEPGAHINAAGSNSLARREIDENTLRRVRLVAVDTVATALREAGDLLPAMEAGWLHARQLVEVGDILTGRAAGRSDAQQITLFESQGLAVQDLALGARLVALARERGVGTEIPLGG
jgi:ornithine cyclodeaminase